ncbi:MAG: carotenoid 1,2-hydratase [Candidatus Competibacteraceae bacterium]|nr:carotenoid 1,2-hydratase [Candidatus Competibacteraceae bacterium]
MLKRARWLVGLLLATALLGATAYRFWPRPQAAESVAVRSALSGPDDAGYRRAYAPQPFHFPSDHGPHPDFRTEWWYVTGNLSAAGGRPFGYQLTLFRIALAPTPPPADSAWRGHQVYMGHFALTDVTGKQFHAFERFSRGALGLAGARAAPFRVWLEDWALSGTENDVFPLRVQARQEGVALDLTLTAAKPLVLQGDRGLSQKSAAPGNASYYYSYTRLPTRGTIRLGEKTFEVSGASWLDREWSTSALGPEQSGWDWFALQLDDGRELMFYRMRRKDGGADSYSKGVLVGADGQSRPLSQAEIELQPLGQWRSPASGDRYPAGWRLRLPAENLELTVTPKLADQELRLTVRYWEGAVTVSGRSGDQPISGQGYLEMTRYETPIRP